MDGYSDVIWQDPVTGLAQVWFLGGAGTSTIGAVNLTASNTWRIVDVGGAIRDGRPDVVWQDPVTGAAQVWSYWVVRSWQRCDRRGESE